MKKEEGADLLWLNTEILKYRDKRKEIQLIESKKYFSMKKEEGDNAWADLLWRFCRKGEDNRS